MLFKYKFLNIFLLHGIQRNLFEKPKKCFIVLQDNSNFLVTMRRKGNTILCS